MDKKVNIVNLHILLLYLATIIYPFKIWYISFHILHIFVYKQVQHCECLQRETVRMCVISSRLGLWRQVFFCPAIECDPFGTGTVQTLPSLDAVAHHAIQPYSSKECWDITPPGNQHGSIQCPHSWLKPICVYVRLNDSKEPLQSWQLKRQSHGNRLLFLCLFTRTMSVHECIYISVCVETREAALSTIISSYGEQALCFKQA